MQQLPESRVRQRRQKYAPPIRSELELFDKERHIQKGEYFDQELGKLQKKMISISTDKGIALNNRISTFDQCGFIEEIKKNIKLRDYNVPTPIQQAIIPLIQTTKNDIMANAQTGSGKTAAFLLPIINNIQTLINERIRCQPSNMSNRDSPYCIILLPTKELAEQLYEEANTFAAGTKVKVARSYGDMPMAVTMKYKEMGCDIFVVTCGRLRHHVIAKHIKLDKLRYFILDEADKLIKDNNFRDSVLAVNNDSNKCPSCRICMFSATYENDVQMEIVEMLRPGYITVHVGEWNTAVETVTQIFIEKLRYQKVEELIRILKDGARERIYSNNETAMIPAKKTIVFVEQKRQADRIALILREQKFNAMSINSDRSLKQRYEVIDKFKRGLYQIIVATDLTARGLNIPNVEHVINYDLPERHDDNCMYIHRIGRTGRAGNTGMATSFFDPENTENRNKAVYYIQILENAKQIVPEFLRVYSIENLNNIRQQLYDEHALSSERLNALCDKKLPPLCEDWHNGESWYTNGKPNSENNYENHQYLKPITIKTKNIWEEDDEEDNNVTLQVNAKNGYREQSLNFVKNYKKLSKKQYNLYCNNVVTKRTDVRNCEQKEEVKFVDTW